VLALSNLLLVIDLLVIEWMDFQIVRLSLSPVAISALLLGFIWNGED